MYGHGFATLALAELYGMTHRADVRPKLEDALPGCQGWLMAAL